VEKNKVKPASGSWAGISVKEKAAIITACISFGLGWVLLFLGLFLGEVGDISAGVLTGFGTALLYAAGIFGVAMYFKHGSTELANKIGGMVQDGIESALKK